MFNVAVVGATGAVGTTMLRVLEERGFPVTELRPLASARSAGRTLDYLGKPFTVQELTTDSFAGIDIALFSAGGSRSRDFAPAAVDAGAVVIDNSSYFRMRPDVPLVVPEVNEDAIPAHQGIIANPNCVAAPLVVALKPIADAVGLERVVVELGRALPPGERFFDEDTITDQSERSIVSEMIREKVMLATQEELPYAAAVSIDLFEDLRPKLVRIIATVHVERDSQKPIVIGKQGERIKGIGIRARAEIEAFVGCKVYLELHVRVTSDWSNNRRLLAELGYAEERMDSAALVLDEDDEDMFEEAEA